MWQLYGGGISLAAAQVATVYYGVSIVLHVFVPLLFSPKSLQMQARRKHQALVEGSLQCRSATPLRSCILKATILVYKKTRACPHVRSFCLAGPILVKACVLTIVENIIKSPGSQLYEGPIDTFPKVLAPSFHTVLVLTTLQASREWKVRQMRLESVHS